MQINAIDQLAKIIKENENSEDELMQQKLIVLYNTQMQIFEYSNELMIYLSTYLLLKSRLMPLYRRTGKLHKTRCQILRKFWLP